MWSDKEIKEFLEYFGDKISPNYPLQIEYYKRIWKLYKKLDN